VPPFQKVRASLISRRAPGSVNFDRLNCRANIRENEPACRAAVGRSVSDILEHDPGSPNAIAEGCTCSPVLNNDGAGNVGPDGRPRFVCDQACPLHGFSALRQALKDGEARVIDGSGAEDELTVESPTIH
jgi:hypothetical protein